MKTTLFLFVIFLLINIHQQKKTLVLKAAEKNGIVAFPDSSKIDMQIEKLDRLFI
jgi:hypothetical protein